VSFGTFIHPFDKSIFGEHEHFPFKTYFFLYKNVIFERSEIIDALPDYTVKKMFTTVSSITTKSDYEGLL